MSSNRHQVIQDALAEAQRALSAVQKERADLAAQEDSLLQEVEGLQMALSAWTPKPTIKDRLGGGVAQFILSATEANKWRAIPRTVAIERVFAEANQPLHRQALRELLRAKGRLDDDLKDISAALAYLKRIGKVDSLGDGVWAATHREAFVNGKLEDVDPLDLQPYSHVSGEAVGAAGGDA